MAEKDDLVEAALAAMEETDIPEDPLAEDDAGSDGTPVDPFEAAQEAIDAVGSEGDAAEGGEGEAADPFEAALSALDDDDSGGSEDVVEDGESSEDPFAAALEIAKTEQKTGKLQKTDEEGERSIDIDFLMEIKLELTFEVGRTKMYISDLLSLGQGSVIELHRLVGEELELFVNGRMLATGEVVVINEKFGARISKILSPEDRIERLGADLDSFF